MLEAAGTTWHLPSPMVFSELQIMGWFLVLLVLLGLTQLIRACDWDDWGSTRLLQTTAARDQFAPGHGVSSSCVRVGYGVPPGSGLGHASFRKGSSAAGLSVRCCADDAQLYLSMKPEGTQQLGATEVLKGPGQGSSSLTGLLAEPLLRPGSSFHPLHGPPAFASPASRLLPLILFPGGGTSSST